MNPTEAAPRVPQSASDEEWIELDFAPHYLVSTHGRLFDQENNAFVPLRSINHPAPQVPTLVWYLRIEDPRTGRRRSRGVAAARTVLWAFEGPPRSGADRRAGIPVYADGDHRNLHLSNLSWRPAAVKW